jgi:hypothetical protein
MKKDTICETFTAALVIEPLTKYYEYVVTVDCKSLYPTTMIQYNIGLDTLCYWPDFMIYSNGEYISPFDKTKCRIDDVPIKLNDSLIRIVCFYILPHIRQSKIAKLQVYLTKLRDETRSKKAANQVEEYILEALQLAIKLQMNGIYGVTSTDSYCSFNIILAATITAKGRNTLFSLYLYCELYFSRYNQCDQVKVIYGDTDSVFVSFCHFTSYSLEFFDYIRNEYTRVESLKLIYQNSFQNTKSYKEICNQRFNIDTYIALLDEKHPNYDSVYKFFLKKLGNIHRVKHLKTFLKNLKTIEYEPLFEKLGKINHEQMFKEYLSRFVWPFDRQIYMFIQQSMLYHYSFLPRNRILYKNHKWSELSFVPNGKTECPKCSSMNMVNFYNENVKIPNEHNEHCLRNHDYCFESSSNIRLISFEITFVNLERQLEPFIILAKKNYIGQQLTEHGSKIHSKGGSLFSAKQPLPAKNFLCSFWNVLLKPSQNLTNEQKKLLDDAFDAFSKWSDSDFIINQKLGKEPSDYDPNLSYIKQIKKINQLGLGSFTQGSRFNFYYTSHIFKDPYMANKCDHTQPGIAKFLKKNAQCTKLLVELFEHVKQSPTEHDMSEYLSTISNLKDRNIIEHNKGMLIERTKNHFFKYGLNTIKVDREQHLRNAVGTQITGLLNALDPNILSDLFSYFNNLWNSYFHVDFCEKKSKLNQEILFDVIRAHNFKSMHNHKRIFKCIEQDDNESNNNLKTGTNFSAKKSKTQDRIVKKMKMLKK